MLLIPARRILTLKALLFSGVLLLALQSMAWALEPVAEAIVRESAADLRQAAEQVPHDIRSLDGARTKASTQVEQLHGDLREAQLSRATYADFLDSAARQIKRAETPAEVRVELRRVADRLDAMARGLPTPQEGLATNIDTAAVHAALVSELSNDAYAQAGAMNEALLLAAWGRLSKWWNGLFDTELLEGLGRGSFYIMVALLTLTTLALLYVYVRSLMKRRGHPAAREVEVLLEEERIADPAEYARQAAECAAEGRYREALRWEFLRILAEFERAKLVAFDRTRTNSEYVQQLRRHAPGQELIQAFTALTRAYNGAWYGHEACSKEMYARFNRGATQAIRLAGASQ